MQENTDQKNSEYGHFLRSELLFSKVVTEHDVCLTAINKSRDDIWAKTKPKMASKFPNHIRVKATRDGGNQEVVENSF